MSYKKSVYLKAKEILSQRKAAAEREAEMRHSAAVALCPEIARVESEIASYGLDAVKALVDTKAYYLTVASSRGTLINDKRTSARTKATSHAAAKVALGISTVTVEEHLDRCALFVLVIVSRKTKSVVRAYLNALSRHRSYLFDPAEYLLPEGLIDLAGRNRILLGVFFTLARVVKGHIKAYKRRNNNGYG